MSINFYENILSIPSNYFPVEEITHLDEENQTIQNIARTLEQNALDYEAEEFLRNTTMEDLQQYALKIDQEISTQGAIATNSTPDANAYDRNFIENREYQNLTCLEEERDSILLAIKTGQVGLHQLNRYWRLDREIIINGLQQETNPMPSLEFVSEKLRDDEEVVLTALRYSGTALQYASKRLRDNKEIVLTALERSSYALKHASERLKNDKEFILAVIIHAPHILKYISRELKDDKEVVLAAVKNSGIALRYSSRKLQNDKEIVLVAINRSGQALRYASSQWRSNKEIVIIAVAKSGAALQYASKKLKDDRDVVAIAIKKSPKALKYATQRIRDQIYRKK